MWFSDQPRFHPDAGSFVRGILGEARCMMLKCINATGQCLWFVKWETASLSGLHGNCWRMPVTRCIRCFSHCCELMRSNAREARFALAHGSKVQFIMEEGMAAGCWKAAEACSWDPAPHVLFGRRGNREQTGSKARPHKPHDLSSMTGFL